MFNKHTNSLNSFFAQKRVSIFGALKCFVIYGVYSIFFRRSVAKIRCFRIISISVNMSDNGSKWSFSKKCLCNKFMNCCRFLRFISWPFKKRNTWIVGAKIYFTNKSFTVFNTSKSTFAAYFINTLVPIHRFPNFNGA